MGENEKVCTLVRIMHFVISSHVSKWGNKISDSSEFVFATSREEARACFRAVRDFLLKTRQSGKQVGGKGAPMGSWRAPGEPMTPEASHSPQLASQIDEFEKKSSRPLNKAQAFFLRQLQNKRDSWSLFY